MPPKISFQSSKSWGAASTVSSFPWKDPPVVPSWMQAQKSTKSVIDLGAVERDGKGPLEGWLRKQATSRNGVSANLSVSYVVQCDSDGHNQVLNYDIKSLVMFGGILNALSTGSLFTDRFHLRSWFLLHLGALILTTCVVLLVFSDHENMDVDRIQRLSGVMNYVAPLAVGLYLSLALERWWTLRIDALGRVCDCALDITQQVGAFLPAETEVVELVARWSMASVNLLMNAARNRDDLSHMVKRGRLLEKEAQALDGVALYGRAMLMWAWIMRITHESLMRGTGPEPYSNYVYVLMDVCIQARKGIQTIHTHLQTGLPFAYVHVVAFTVDALVSVSTLKCSMVCVHSFYQEPRLWQNICYQIVLWIVVPLLYHGLLTVAGVIYDPFTGDMSDFPISTYMEWYAAQIDAVMNSQRRFPWAEWEELANSPRSPEAKAAAARVVDKSQETDTVKSMAEKAAAEILKEAVIEASVQVRRSLRGFSEELKSLHDTVDRTSEKRASDAEFLLTKLHEQ